MRCAADKQTWKEMQNLRKLVMYKTLHVPIPAAYSVKLPMSSYFHLRNRRLEGNSLVPYKCIKPAEKILSPEGSMPMLNLLNEITVYCVTPK